MSVHFERHGPRPQEAEQDVCVVPGRRNRNARNPARHLNPGHALGRRPDPRLPRLEPRDPPGLPGRLGLPVQDEFRPLELPLGTEMRGGQLHLVIHAGEVLGGNTDLDHLDPCRGLEDPVANLRGLDHAIPGAQHEWRPLVLVDEPHPAAVAEDELEADRMEMDHVGDRARFSNADVGSDDGASQTVGEQVAVVHARAADDPGLGVYEPPDDELVRRLGDDERGIRVFDGHSVAAGGDEVGLTAGKCGRVVRVEP